MVGAVFWFLWKWVRRTWRGLLAISVVLGIVYILPDLRDLPDNYPGLKMFSLPERETVLFWALGIAAAYILWMDFRPYVSERLKLWLGAIWSNRALFEVKRKKAAKEKIGRVTRDFFCLANEELGLLIGYIASRMDAKLGDGLAGKAAQKGINNAGPYDSEQLARLTSADHIRFMTNRETQSALYNQLCTYEQRYALLCDALKAAGPYYGAHHAELVDQVNCWCKLDKSLYEQLEKLTEDVELDLIPGYLNTLTRKTDLPDLVSLRDPKSPIPID